MCQSHVRPYYEFLADLSADRVPRYNFITPNLINPAPVQHVLSTLTYAREHVEVERKRKEREDG